MKKWIWLLVLILLCGCQGQEKTAKKETKKDTTKEVQEEKKLTGLLALHVDGTVLKDENNDIIQLKGLSTHGLGWYPQYVSKETFSSLKKDFNINTIRLAMYTDGNQGYCTVDENRQKELRELIDRGVAYTKELNMYAIIDWHILSDGNPLQHKDAALAFFKEMANTYQDEKHVIYEICNEPNGTTSWNEIKTYSQEVISIIREYDDDAIIIVGTPNLSQDVDQITPIEDKNIVYALHFYADSHRRELRSKLLNALDKKIPVFVSEFGICDASGNGAINEDEAKKWLDLLTEKNNSYVAWNISNKNETSSILKESCQKVSDFNEDDYSVSGLWLKKYMNNEIETDSDKVNVIINADESWQNGNENVQKYSVIIQNNQESRTNWTIKVEFNQEVKVNDYWNCDYQLDGKTMTLTPKDYNKTLTPQQKYNDIGLILQYSGNLEIEKITFE